MLERWKNDALETKIQLLSTVIGIKKNTAITLVEHFGSLASILTANRKQLIEVENIDSNTAEKILQAISMS